MNDTAAVLRQVRGLLMQAEGLLAAIAADTATELPTLALHREPEPCPAFRHGGDYSVCHWGGRVYRFSVMQRAVVRRLHEAHEDGRPHVGNRDLLDAAGSDSMALRDLFRGHKAWGELIVRVAPTVYALAFAGGEIGRAA